MSYIASGYKNISSDPKIKLAKKQTLLDRYGVDNSSKIPEVKDKLSKISSANHTDRMAKAKLTTKDRYGVDHYSQTAEYKEKYRNTSIKKYGVDHVLKSPVVRTKYIDTMIENHGVDNPSKDARSMHQRDITNLDKYGSTCSAQSFSIQQTIADNNKLKYGVSSTFQRPDVIEKSLITRQLKKYDALLSTFKEEWRKEYFDNGLHAALIKFPKIKVKTAMDTFLTLNERSCSQGRSHCEQFIRNYLENTTGLLFEHSIRSIVPGNNRLEVDMLNREHKISIEFDGYYWHQVVNNKINDDFEKCLKMREDGWIHISLNETDLHKLPKIAEIISPNKNMIAARKCKIISVNSAAERKFMDLNHLDGYVSSQHAYGLEYNGELIQMMTFTSDRFGQKEQRGELLRLCTASGNGIIGGAQKLFKHAKMMSHYNSYVAYSNNKFFNGNVYSKLGFIFEKYTPPGYVWFKNNEILKRYATMKHKLPSLLGDRFDITLTEEENMIKSGWTKINDFGHQKWIYY